MNLTRKIIRQHLAHGHMQPGAEIGLTMDQTLTQDATGTMAWLQFEALGLPRVRNELSLSYVDHNTLQTGFRNPDDHRFLRTAAARFGAVFSPPGNGICHQLHLENFAKPGATLVGSDSHTPTAGGMASLAMGAGGLSVALAMAGNPYTLPMPKVCQVWLTGQLQGWATAKDVILELLRRLTVKGGVGRVFEYAGPGVGTLGVPERATITNMGAELGATSSIFPSDERTREFLAAMGREGDWQPLAANDGAEYDERLEVDLSNIVPMAACPHMPDKVVPVAELAGLKVDQVAIGSCTNSSYADLQQVSHLLQNHTVAPSTDVCVAPGSRQVLALLALGGQEAPLQSLLAAGVRILECACGPCIGVGSSPVSGGVSVRTFNRNFEGRSGTRDAGVYLVSPLTAAKCALDGCFTNPEQWGQAPVRPKLPAQAASLRPHFLMPPENGANVEIARGPNIVALETFAPLPQVLEGEVVIHLPDDITTDHIMPAGSEILALRSNVPAISRHVFERVDAAFPARAEAVKNAGKAGIIVAGQNYGQGSSREHAALAPRHLGIRAVLALSFARIHRANLVNFGIVPLTFENTADYDTLTLGESLCLHLEEGTLASCRVRALAGKKELWLKHDLSAEEMNVVRAGGLLNMVRLQAG